MYDHHLQEDPLFCMLYGGVLVMAILAGIYLLFRRANAIAPAITPPMRLRRWTANYFFVLVLGHLWYLPVISLTSSDDVKLLYLVGGLLDSMMMLPMSICLLLVMLQDRQRPLWPVCVMVAPLVVLMALRLVSFSDAQVPVIYAYLVLLAIGLIIYMMRALRQYGRWLRDNYADLEHKEVWLTFVVQAAIFFAFAFYVSGDSITYYYVVQLIDTILVIFLLWRVETLSDLSHPRSLHLPAEEPVGTAEPEQIAVEELTPINYASTIEPLLQQFCIDTQLYLKHDLTLTQLAKAVGTNRFYLSQYFSSLGMTYNAYINDLRIQHFVRLYGKAVDSQQRVTALQLANESGYRSYSTFALAFKQRMGQPVTEWMHEYAK